MIYLGEDLGAGANKIYGAFGGMQLQAVVAAETNQTVAKLMGFRNEKPPLSIHTAGMNFYVGPNAHAYGRGIENFDFERMTGVPETRAIVYGILTRYMQQFGVFTDPLHMVVGLPLEPLSGDQAQQNADATRRWLLGEHIWLADDIQYKVHIAEVKVTSQPSAALFDYLLDENGLFIPERRSHFNHEIGIISVGFNTIELLTVREKTIVQSLTAGRTLGVRRLLELVNYENLYSMGELDTFLRSGKLDIKAALPVWTREITGQIEKTWGKKWRRFDQIIGVGGGAILLQDSLIQCFDGKLFIPEDPVLAISRGLYKQALQHANRRKV